MDLMVSTGGFHVVSQSSTRPADAEVYLKAALTLAYQGTWGALTNSFNGTVKVVNYIEPTSVVLSSVSKWRMDVCLGTQFLLTLACVLVGILQTRSRRPVVTNHVLKCKRYIQSAMKYQSNDLLTGELVLLLDNSLILANDRNGLRGAPSLSDQDKLLDRLAFARGGGKIYRDVLRFRKVT